MSEVPPPAAGDRPTTDNNPSEPEKGIPGEGNPGEALQAEAGADLVRRIFEEEVRSREPNAQFYANQHDVEKVVAGLVAAGRLDEGSVRSLCELWLVGQNLLSRPLSAGYMKDSLPGFREVLARKERLKAEEEACLKREKREEERERRRKAEEAAQEEKWRRSEPGWPFAEKALSLPRPKSNSDVLAAVAEVGWDLAGAWLERHGWKGMDTEAAELRRAGLGDKLSAAVEEGRRRLEPTGLNAPTEDVNWRMIQLIRRVRGYAKTP